MPLTTSYSQWQCYLLGEEIGIGIVALGALCSRLDECERNVVKSVERYDVVNYVDVDFLRLFLWERFEALCTIPKIFKAVHPRGSMGWTRSKPHS